MYWHRESVLGVNSYQQRIPRKNKIKKTSDALIAGKETVQEPVNPNKSAKEDTIPDIEKSGPKETPPPFKNKVDYIGDTT